MLLLRLILLVLLCHSLRSFKSSVHPNNKLLPHSRIFSVYSTVKGIDEGKIKSVTHQWVKDWVVGKQLCPWANKILVENKLKLVIEQSGCHTLPGIWNVRQRLFHESTELLTNLQSKIQDDTVTPQLLPDSDTVTTSKYETTLLILPALKDFHRFLDMYAL